MRATTSCITAIALAAALQVAPAAAQQGLPANHTQHNVPVDADGALTWEALSNLDIRVETPAPLQTIFHIEFPESLKRLDGETVRLKGFMYPLEAGEAHSTFLLSALPPACPCGCMLPREWPGWANRDHHLLAT